MGLIKAGLGALGSTLADQWLEFITIDKMDSNVLVQRGYPMERGSNTKRTDGVLTKGTKIVVPEGMAMVIVDQGKITEFTAEAGEFIYDSSTEPTMLSGGFGEGLKQSWNRLKESFKFGGEPPKDQRVYYINLREIQGITFGTAEPVAVDDPKYEITVYVRCYGKYSIKITDPIALITNVVGSATGDTVKIDIFTNGQIREEFMTSLVTAMASIAYEQNLSITGLVRCQGALAQKMNEELDEDWRQKRGIEIISVAIPSISLTDESKEDLRKYQEMNYASKNAQGMMTAAAAQSMRDAAKNEGGMAGAFMGMNIGNMAGQNMGQVAGAVFNGNARKWWTTTTTKYKYSKSGLLEMSKMWNNVRRKILLKLWRKEARIKILPKLR